MFMTFCGVDREYLSETNNSKILSFHLNWGLKCFEICVLQSNSLFEIISVILLDNWPRYLDLSHKTRISCSLTHLMLWDNVCDQEDSQHTKKTIFQTIRWRIVHLFLGIASSFKTFKSYLAPNIFIGTTIVSKWYHEANEA